MNSDYDKFPAKIYSKTVLEPDFEIYKSYFYENLFDINISHAIMLFEQKILNKKETQVIPIGVIHFISPINPKIIHEIGSPNVIDHQSLAWRFFIARYLDLNLINR